MGSKGQSKTHPGRGGETLNISISLQMANIERFFFQLEQDEGTIIGEENLKVFISEYYKGLFGAPPQNNFTLLEDRIDDIPQLSSEEKNVLSADFTEMEVKEAVMQMKKNKAPGPDGFPTEFYQVFWDTIKKGHNGHVLPAPGRRFAPLQT
jgi:hypothetical protein